jgi:hypothetical protein
MKKTIVLIAILSPIALIAVLMTPYVLNLPQPVSGKELYDSQQLFPGVEGDQIVGGGYVFMQDGRDVWMRVRTSANFSNQPLPGSSSTCSPESFQKIQAWFLDRVKPQKILGLIPIANNDDLEIDRAVLSDRANLRCGNYGIPNEIENSFGKPPKDCTTSWVLYYKSNGFYYRRLACIH